MLDKDKFSEEEYYTEWGGVILLWFIGNAGEDEGDTLNS